MNTTSDSVPRFDRRVGPDAPRITRIGDGELGGKAACLVRADREILDRLDTGAFPGLEIAVPRLTVLTTDLFDLFVRHNGLDALLRSDEPDEAIARAFQAAELPSIVVGDLRALAESYREPIAVRSSSLLEDDLRHPFAGVYETKMLPNQAPSADARFRQLVEAIKLVYASTYFHGARSYARSAGRAITEEKMAVVVQQVVGERRDQRFYPTLSGVARSYNHYPQGRSQPEDGVVSLSLGLGKTIVDGGACWTYSPRHPRRPMPFGDARSLMRGTQSRFWAIHMGAPPPHDPIRETEFLVQPGLREAEYDDTLRFVASTYDRAADCLRPGVGNEGPRALDFAPLRIFDDIPLTAALRRLLALSETALGGAVEMEFAVNLDRQRGVPAEFGFLQVRPMAVSSGVTQVTAEDLDGREVLIASHSTMGDGSRDDIEDVVYLDPDAFDAAHTAEMAVEVERIDRILSAQGRSYALIGFGRWGSSDRWLGVPVTWGQIQGARVIIEASRPGMSPDPSQGSHFVQNLIAFSVLYMTVRHDGAGGVDWSRLSVRPNLADARFVRHVRFDRPLTVRVDGNARRGVIAAHD
jgi:hypothetical protein